ncbi:hypothetical protein BUALT_Bualt01G0144600 [Buddleja alternifolia]|uniref:Transposase (putative) gypsy type domain-containing protein n=1 Tax=Buddleja alternifolia TaxID=168488 RepID=A0AAV6YHX6_9LAMI|nr:hypothetical protein BUALT_Bualt01G0144600 [Buddleja alternifolia]
MDSFTSSMRNPKSFCSVNNKILDVNSASRSSIESYSEQTNNSDPVRSAGERRIEMDREPDRVRESENESSSFEEEVPDYLVTRSSIQPREFDEIRERYHIPVEFKLHLPGPEDRMHLPPRSTRTFCTVHLEASLRFPLHPAIVDIISGFEISPTQLVPNAYRIIICFIILMTRYGIEPTFSRFWSLYYITPSTKTDLGFFYFSPRSGCKTIHKMPSSLGSWKEKFFFVEPPRTKPWRMARPWRLEAPNIHELGEATFEEGFIENTYARTWYLAKKNASRA